MKNRLSRMKHLIVALILVSGCLGSKTPPVSRPPAPAVLVDYYRTGGFAGFNDLGLRAFQFFCVPAHHCDEDGFIGGRAFE